MQPTSNGRFSTGIEALDKALGGGLLPGTLTVIVGATGVGKTQLGIRWCCTAGPIENSPGAIIDLSSRGDSQNHIDYAQKLAGIELKHHDLKRIAADQLFSNSQSLGNLLRLFGYEGRRVLRSQLDVDQWDAWQSQLNRQTPALVEYVYRHLIGGTRRFLIDGIEPQDRPEDSLQMDMLELIYHRMLRQPHDWLARELFRQDFRAMQQQVEQKAYDCNQASAVLLVTTRESMLDQLIAKPWAEGDLAAGANTILLMGRIPRGNQFSRGLFIAKHRGSYCDDSVLEFSINPAGLQFLPSA
jgi:KaiC